MIAKNSLKKYQTNMCNGDEEMLRKLLCSQVKFNLENNRTIHVLNGALMLSVN